MPKSEQGKDYADKEQSVSQRIADLEAKAGEFATDPVKSAEILEKITAAREKLGRIQAKAAQPVAEKPAKAKREEKRATKGTKRTGRRS